MSYKSLFKQARDLYSKAAECEDAEERKDFIAQAEDLVERAESAQKAAGIPTSDDLDKKLPAGVTKPEWGKLEGIMVDQGWTDDQIKAMRQSLNGDNGKGGVATGEEKEYTFGQFLKAVRYQERPESQQVLKAMGAKADMQEGTGIYGGYLVPVQQLNELLMVPDTDAVVRPRARKIRMTGRSLTIPVLDQGDAPASAWKVDYYGGVLAHWTEEGGTKTESEPEFKQLELVAHKLAGYSQASDELLMDSAIGLESLLMDIFRGAVSFHEDYTFLRGTGVGQPLGVLSSGALLTQNRATANNIEYRDLARMMDDFLPSSWGNAVWCVSHTALPELLTMEDTEGTNVFVPNASGGVTQSIPGTILGRPIVMTEKLPALGTTGDVLLADFSYYIIGDRQATTIAASEHFAFTSDLTTWRFVHRVDGQPWLDEPIYIDTTNTVSPFVALSSTTTS